MLNRNATSIFILFLPKQDDEVVYVGTYQQEPQAQAQPTPVARALSVRYCSCSFFLLSFLLICVLVHIV